MASEMRRARSHGRATESGRPLRQLQTSLIRLSDRLRQANSMCRSYPQPRPYAVPRYRAVLSGVAVSCLLACLSGMKTHFKNNLKSVYKNSPSPFAGDCSCNCSSHSDDEEALPLHGFRIVPRLRASNCNSACDHHPTGSVTRRRVRASRARAVATECPSAIPGFLARDGAW
jgi:hypothetical protein